MPRYDDWNRAIITYLVEGMPRGTPIFLAVDDDVLAAVGRSIAVAAWAPVDAPAAADPRAVDAAVVRDFCQAVHRRVVGAGDRVALAWVRGLNDQGEPRAVAFLAALVLAASRMAAEGEVFTPNNYFGRLREVLRLSGDSGRPRGLERGAEEPLWLEWNRWLQGRGLLPTAKGGTHSTAYIQYAIGQCLLRRADRDRLLVLFAEERWLGDVDAATLAARLRRQPPHVLSAHLRDLLADAGPRARAVAEAVYELHQQWRDGGALGPDRASGRGAAGSRAAPFTAGLYRVADPFSGQVDYHLYPRVPRRVQVRDVRVRIDGESRRLTVERPGWFAPLDPVAAEALDAGRRYPVEAPPDLPDLTLPRRPFWLLVPDPEGLADGVYADWGSPRLGEPFVLLARAELRPALERWRAERLLEWAGEPRPRFGGAWVELPHCQVVSEAWRAADMAGAHADDALQALADALRPDDRPGLSLSGGLRVPEPPGWLDGHGPSVTVAAFRPPVALRVIREADGRLVHAVESAPNGQPVEARWPGPGDYLVEAEAGGRTAQRLVRIVDWAAVRAIAPARREAMAVGGHTLAGAVISQ